jgi:hypothetical protein
MTTIAPALEAHLRAMSAPQQKRLAAESRKALRTAWPCRNTDLRARLVIESNVRMLRNLATL